MFLYDELLMNFNIVVNKMLCEMGILVCIVGKTFGCHVDLTPFRILGIFHKQ
jgi:hypothetical protein